MAPDDDDYYSILGVDHDASPDEIKRSFKGKAKACHPDLHPGDDRAHERFVQLNKAYYVLVDASEREAYDVSTGMVPPATITTCQPPSNQAVTRPRRIVHVHQDPGSGVEPSLRVEAGSMPGFGTLMEAACPACRGSGISSTAREQRCNICGGSGWIPVSRAGSGLW